MRKGPRQAPGPRSSPLLPTGCAYLTTSKVVLSTSMQRPACGCQVAMGHLRHRCTLSVGPGHSTIQTSETAGGPARLRHENRWLTSENRLLKARVGDDSARKRYTPMQRLRILWHMAYCRIARRGVAEHFLIARSPTPRRFRSRTIIPRPSRSRCWRNSSRRPHPAEASSSIPSLDQGRRSSRPSERIGLASQWNSSLGTATSSSLDGRRLRGAGRLRAGAERHV